MQHFLRQKEISQKVTERWCPQSNWLAQRLNLIIMDKVHCMLIDANLTPKLWVYASEYAVLGYSNVPHSAFKKCARLRWQVSIYRWKSKSRSLPRRGTCYSSSSGSRPARLEDSRISPQGTRERWSNGDLAHARMLQLPQLGLTASVIHTLDSDFILQRSAQKSKSEGWVCSMR